MPVSATADEITGWVTGRIPDDWFDGQPEVLVDRDEVLIIGRLSEPKLGEGASEEQSKASVKGRIEGFREDTRARRMKIASEAERKFRRQVSWGVEVGDHRKLFTNLSAPVMTRLRMPERSVLDTLVDAGVARSRSDALVWCVRLVGKHEAEWISELREAFAKVEEVRASGPDA